MQKAANNRASRALIVAEAGVNHDGSVATACELIAIAAEAGADAVKFQTFAADRLATRSAPKAAYQVETTGGHESQWAMLKRLEIGADDHRVLIDECERRNIEFLSAPFDEQSADLLVELGVRRLKVPSGEATNLPFLRHLAGLGKPLILSTGMCDLGDVAAAVATIRRHGDPPLSLLHCVSAYPARAADCNLRAMETMASTFDVPVGFSDHTLGIEVSLAAVALGAAVIEKHFTLDPLAIGPDHRASLSPAELHSLVAGIRSVESALGDGIKRAVEAERNTQQVARKSIVAVRPIAVGQTIFRDDLAIRRPGTGLPPSELERVIGQRSLYDIPAGEPVMARAVFRDNAQ